MLEGIYNHGPSIDVSAHPTYRTAALDPDAITQINTLSSAGLGPAQILSVIRKQFP